MLTQEDWDEAREYWEGWLDNFEKEIYPVFYRRGYSKNTALQVYALACDPTTIEDEQEDDEWRKTN